MIVSSIAVQGGCPLEVLLIIAGTMAIVHSRAVLLYSLNRCILSAHDISTVAVSKGEATKTPKNDRISTPRSAKVTNNRTFADERGHIQVESPQWTSPNLPQYLI